MLALLPKWVDKDRFQRIIFAILGAKDCKVANCHPKSIFNSISLAAQMGLEPGAPGQGWLSPYKGECKFNPGYMGLCTFVLGMNDNLLAISRDLDSALRAPAEGERAPGTIGRLLYEAELYDQLEQAVRVLTGTLEEAREAAPIATFLNTVFLGF